MFSLGKKNDEVQEKAVEVAETTDKPKKTRTRRHPLVIADEKEAKGHKYLDEAKAIREKFAKDTKKKARKERLSSVSNLLLKVIDDIQLPEGVKEADFIAALRLMFRGLRKGEQEDKTAFRNRVAPAIEAIFGSKENRDPAKEAAVRVLIGHPKAAEYVSALHQITKKATTKNDDIGDKV